jgi:transcriptional regulator GlxA family with amidase domain
MSPMITCLRPAKLTRCDSLSKGLSQKPGARSPGAAQLEGLADRLRVTSRTLNRRFKAATGETPLEFLQKARIERARGLLSCSLSRVRAQNLVSGFAERKQ